jgi:2'-5' RNA ligase
VTEAAGEKRRVFIALWPDERTRARLADLADSLPGPGRRVPPAHLHLTLAFPGTVPAERAECLVRNLNRLTIEPFSLSLDRLGHFEAAGVTWAGPSTVPGRLAQLADRARDLCEDCGIELDGRPFVPHVTLRRGTSGPPEDMETIEPIDWQVGTVALVELEAPGHPGAYRLLARVGPDMETTR